MAKILVADDNSNVQKTVTLALADLGVEVVSVNNGEAAVRKLADFSPDLVLADIFMPVRNGYEVCEYIKKDTRFGQVPVVLLVGAFDPLDEREAQRVGADGILKKPFVPPEPLITMVKTLLDRALGERLVAVSASKPVLAAVAKPGGVAVATERSPVPAIADEMPAREFPPSAGRVTFEEGEHPVAFSRLLETPAQDAIDPATDVIEPVDNEQVLTSSRDATLGEPVFWRNDSPEPEPDAEAPEEEVSAGLEMRTWTKGEDSLPRREEAILLQPIEPLELVHEGPDDTSKSIVESQPILLDQAAQAPLTVDPGAAPELAANPIEWMATAPLEHPEEEIEATPGWDEPIPDATDEIDAVELPENAEVPLQVQSQPAERIPVPVASSLSTKPETKPADNTPEPSKTQPSLRPPLSAQTVDDTARSITKQDWASMNLTPRLSGGEPVSQQVKPVSVPPAQTSATASGSSQPTPGNPAQAPSPDAALVEAVVQRVLDKMRPQVVDIITKEFLRPIVQALVHREIEKQ